MSDIAIRVERLGKRYRIGRRERYTLLSERIGGLVSAALRALRFRGNGHLPASEASLRQPDGETREADTIWALRDVSFEVKPGEVGGIVGRNGAGKSTLLKVLSRITEPTEGEVEIHGRVASLLEVGTGFHMELTGRENIYLNGAILGMKKAEIDRKFDEMVAFAEVEKFIDTPVKHYSSGMHVRLAFAVAAHLEPNVLLVDEVLAVGDAEFQKKCLGRIDDVVRQGRTVLFVSHNMNAVRRLCRTCLLLHEGRLVMTGLTDQVLSEYVSYLDKTAAEQAWSAETAQGDDVARIRSVRVRDAQGATVSSVRHEAEVGVEVVYERLVPDVPLSAYVHFFNEDGVHLFGSSDHLEEASPRPAWTSQRGVIRAVCWVPGRLFREGRISVSVALADNSPALVTHAHLPEVIAFRVSVDRDTTISKPIGWPGVVWPALSWTLDRNLAEAVKGAERGMPVVAAQR